MTAHMLSARIFSDRGFPVHRDAVCLEASAECVAYSAQCFNFIVLTEQQHAIANVCSACNMLPRSL